MSDNERVVKNRRRIKISHVLLVLLLAGIALFAIFRIRTKFRLKERIDAIRAAGYPATCVELDRWYSIPRDVENAAYTCEDAFLSLRKWEGDKLDSLPVAGRAELPPRNEPIPPEMKTLIAEYVVDNNEAIDLLHEAAKIEHCRLCLRDLSTQPALEAECQNRSHPRGRLPGDSDRFGQVVFDP